LDTIRPSFFLLPLRQGEKLGGLICEEKLNRQKWGAYNLAIGKITNGLLTIHSSSVFVLPLGQKMDPGAIAPLFICSTISSAYRLLLKI
jgi:hypothetical protein